MTELIVIRHGETDSNREHRFQGQLDVPLNDTGRLQAERVAARLAGEPFDAVRVSDLQRARQTAAPLAGLLGLLPEADARWREQSFGEIEGMQVRTLHLEHPLLWQRWAEHDADFALPAGESARQFHARILGALRALGDIHPRARVVLVTHGGVLDMLWRTATGESLHGPRRCAIPNASINRLRWDGRTLEIDTWADDAHLAGLPAQPSTVPLSVRLQQASLAADEEPPVP
jgi:probable phosphoglycerate mutase